MGLFSNKLKVGEGQKYDTTKVTTELTAEDLKKLEKKNAKLIDIYKGKDGNATNFSAIDLAYAMDDFTGAAGDGKLSNKELKDLATKLSTDDNKVTAKDIKRFLKDIRSINKKHGTEELANSSEVKNKDQVIQENNLQPVEGQSDVYTLGNQYYKYNDTDKSFEPVKFDESSNSYVPMSNEEIIQKYVQDTVQNDISQGKYEPVDGQTMVVQKDGQFFIAVLNDDDEVVYQPAKKVENNGTVSYEPMNDEEIEAAAEAATEQQIIAQEEVDTEQTQEVDTEAPQEADKNTPTAYTVQLGEDYTDLIKRSLIALHEGEEGYTPSADEIAAAKAQFEADNPNLVKSRNGVKYLLAASTVKIRGGLEDKNNKQEVIEQYNEAISTRRAAARRRDSASEAPTSPPADPTPSVVPAQTVAAKRDALKKTCIKDRGYSATEHPDYIKKEKDGLMYYYQYDANSNSFKPVQGLCGITQNGVKTYSVNNGVGRLEIDNNGKEIKRYSASASKWKTVNAEANDLGMKKVGDYYCTKDNNKFYKYDSEQQAFVVAEGVSNAAVGTNRHIVKKGTCLKLFDNDGKELQRYSFSGTADKDAAAKECGLSKIQGNHGYYCDQNVKPVVYYKYSQGKFIPNPNIKSVDENGNVTYKN